MLKTTITNAEETLQTLNFLLSEVQRLKKMCMENSHYKQALLDADTVARQRGDEFGLCDCIDNNGNPYPSQLMADVLEIIRIEGYMPQLRLRNTKEEI